jgi:glycosyltransferase involved in cell wall biosynthesis
MKILFIHNFYQERGGEDTAREAEMQILRGAGHTVIEFLRSNDEIREYSLGQKVSLAWRTSWSVKTYRQLRALLLQESPNVAHFHNIFPLVSPSAYYACSAAGIPVVQTLHNYRLLCPGGNLFRNGRVCEECIQHSLLRSVVHGCYHDSRPQTAVVAGMLGLHRFLGTWEKHVSQFLVCTEFARKKFVEAGFDAECLTVKPNFVVADPGPRPAPGRAALFCGRVSQEKGPELLVKAWMKLPFAVPLEIAGDGPLRSSLERDCAERGLRDVHFAGWLDRSAVQQRLRDARFLVVPSTCYEGFPLAIAEAYASGVPVIASCHGALAEIVLDGQTGLHFNSGDAISLAAKVEWAWTHPAEMDCMGRAARREFETKYSASVALRSLETAYERARKRCAKSPCAPASLIASKSPALAKHMNEAD